MKKKLQLALLCFMIIGCKEPPKRDWQTKEEWRQTIIKDEKEKYDLFIVMGYPHIQATDSVRANRQRLHDGTIYKNSAMQEWFEEYESQDTAYLYNK